MNQTNLALLVAELRRDEGVEYDEYIDPAGIPSTGVGHNLRVSPLPVGWSFPLSDAQVDQLLTQDLGNTFAQLNASLSWWVSLDVVRQRVVANMAYNLGVDGLLTFHNTLLAMQRGSYAVAAAGMKASAWYSEVGDRAARLCAAMETGVMPDEPIIA